MLGVGPELAPQPGDVRLQRRVVGVFDLQHRVADLPAPYRSVEALGEVREDGVLGGGEGDLFITAGEPLGVEVEDA